MSPKNFNNITRIGVCAIVAATFTTLIPASTAFADSTSDLNAAQNNLNQAQGVVDRETKDLQNAILDKSKQLKNVNTTATAEITANEKAVAARLVLARLARTNYMGANSQETSGFLNFVLSDDSSLAGLSLEESATKRFGRLSAMDAEAALVSATEAQTRSLNAVSSYQESSQKVDSVSQGLAASRTNLVAALANLEHARMVAACDVGSSSPSISTNDAGKYIWSTLVGQGFSEEAAAGVLGNLQQESGVNPKSVGGIGHGMVQWSSPGRWDSGPLNLLDYSAKNKMDPWSVQAQTAFMLEEMRTSWGGFNLPKFKQMTNIVDATVYMHDTYEISNDTPDFVINTRGGYAKSWYVMLRGSTPVVNVPLGAASTSGTCAALDNPTAPTVTPTPAVSPAPVSAKKPKRKKS